MTIAASPSARDSLRYLRDLGARQNDPRGAAAAQVIDDLLDPANDNILRVLLGDALPPPALTTKARRLARDQHLLRIREHVPGLTAAQLERLISRYRDRWVRRDRALETMPSTYAGRPHEHLYNAFRLSADMMPGERSLYRLLARKKAAKI
jgi:hypothetical protein